MKTQLLFVAVALVLVESVPTPAELGPVYEGLCACVVQNITHPPLIGQYLPQCDDDGNFRRLQCWGSVGSCWCVNPLTGEKINGTETYAGQAPPDCEDQLKWGSACCNETLPFVCSREMEHWEHHD